MCPSHFLSSQSRKPSESESSQIHELVESELSHKNCRVTSSHWFASWSQCRVTWNFTSFLLHCLCYEMAPNMLL